MPRGRSVAIDEMFTIEPPSPLSIMAGMTCFEVRNIASTLTRITRSHRFCVSATTVSRLAMPMLLSRTSMRPNRASAVVRHRLALVLVGEVRLVGGRLPALRRDHPHRTLGEVERPIHHEHPGARASEQDGRRPSVADAVSCRAPARDDGDLAFQSEIRVKIGVHRVASPCSEPAVIVRSRRSPGSAGVPPAPGRRPAMDGPAAGPQWFKRSSLPPHGGGGECPRSRKNPFRNREPFHVAGWTATRRP